MSSHMFNFQLQTFNSLHWRHDRYDGVSNHQPHGCLLNRLFRRRSKKTSKLRATGLCAGNSPGPVISRTKGQQRGKCFHLMTSSCFLTVVKATKQWPYALKYDWRIIDFKLAKGSLGLERYTYQSVYLNYIYNWQVQPQRTCAETSQTWTC